MKAKVTLLASTLLCSMSIVAQQKHITTQDVDAANIIRLNNSIVELKAKHADAAKEGYSLLSTAEANIERVKASTINSIPVANLNYIDYQTFEDSFGNFIQYDSLYAIAPNFAKKKEVGNRVNNANLNSKQSVQWAQSISKYFSNKEYTSDRNFDKYNSIKANIFTYFKKAGEDWEGAYKAIVKDTDKAELFLLKKNKIAEFIVPMKSDFNDLKAIISLLNEDKIDTQKILKELPILSKYLDKDKDISKKDLSLLKDEYYKDVYLDFYKYSQKTVDDIKAYTLELERNPESQNLNHLYNNINNSYDSVLESFNSFKTNL